jgi:hypothetical protein
VVTLVLAALTGVAMVAIMHRLGFDAWVITLVVAGMALYLLYLGYTAPEQRNYDARGQHRYLLYIASHAALPPPSYCNVCYHPPLYYVVAAHDFRRVFPLLILSSLVYAQTAEVWRQRLPWLGMGARVIAVLFLVTSTLYFVPKQGVLCRWAAKPTAERLLGGAYRCP